MVMLWRYFVSISKNARQWVSRFAYVIFNYSGARFVLTKFTGKRPNHPDYYEAPSGVLWLIGLYVAIYGVADQIHIRGVNKNRSIQPMPIAAQAIVQMDKGESEICNKTDELERRWLESPMAPFILEPSTLLDSIFGEPVPEFVDYPRKQTEHLITAVEQNAWKLDPARIKSPGLIQNWTQSTRCMLDYENPRTRKEYEAQVQCVRISVDSYCAIVQERIRQGR